MIARGTVLRSGLVVLAIAGAWVLFIALPNRYGGRREASATAAAPVPVQTASAGAVRRITATLYFVGDDGMGLVPVQREVPFGASVAEQARAIIEAQLAPAPPLISALPPDTKLRDVFLTDRGDAFVNLSVEAATTHPGGSLEELFAVYTIVNALTVNLPAVMRVQILVDGKEVDTLAGHVDLRHPLAKSLDWVVVHDTH
ncbi:MAG TPA: GerMN domain-containing protein [Vicinamibacterales bacterium]|nr:GerMN domain-containing protein [Vicinamibacterales bacterium]